MSTTEVKRYIMLPTLKLFHECGAQIRCVVGPVGSGKTSAITWEICYYLPWFCFKTHKMKHTKWVVVRNTYPELRDTSQRTIFEWFGWGHYRAQPNIYELHYPDGPSVEIMFRSCDNLNDVKKFKSLDITGYWIDESIEVADEVKKMLKNRIGRYPQKSPVRFGIETTNPPNIEDPTYWQFAWQTPVPGPKAKFPPLENHIGYWQPPGENTPNLRPGYYEDLRRDYADDPDWIEMYIEGKPGMLIKGRPVYNNFKKDRHVAEEPVNWCGGPLYRGWDNSGNTPACVVVQVVNGNNAQILREFYSDRMNIVDFTQHVVTSCNLLYPNAVYYDWADPAGEQKFSKKGGGFTSNAELMSEVGVNIQSSEQNLFARINAVETILGKYDGLLIDPSCTRLIDGFIAGYHYPQVDTGEYSRAPEKNKYSHIHEALQYIMVKINRSTAASSTGDFKPNRRSRIRRWRSRAYSTT